MNWLVIVLLVVVGIVALTIFFTSFVIVKQQTVVVLERLGKFIRVAQPGFSLKIPWIDTVAGELSLRVQQLDVKVETKTQDNVFVLVRVSVQYVVQPDKVYDAFYKLSDPGQQITAYVFDVVRARVPGIILDGVFEKKDEVADAVKNELQDTMGEFGYKIIKALVTDIDPDKKVKEAMNAINAAQRMRMAAEQEGEANKILQIKAAEAEAASKKLQGQGIADQRKAIIDGLRESVDMFGEAVPGSTPQDVMALVLTTQYFDTIQAIGAKDGTVILLPHSPAGLTDIMGQIREAIISGGQVNQAVEEAAAKSAEGE